MIAYILSLLLSINFISTLHSKENYKNFPRNSTSKASLFFSQISGAADAICGAYELGYIKESNAKVLLENYFNIINGSLGENWLEIPKSNLDSDQYQNIYKPSEYIKAIVFKKHKKCLNIFTKNI